MRRDDAYQWVSESLQADVMRFMAIIAFCLIAILALVRSAQPAPPVEPPPSAPAERVAPAAPADPEPVPVPASPVNVAAAPPQPAPEPAPPPQPETPEPPRQSQPEPAPAQTARLHEPPPPAQPSRGEPDSSAEEGLSLRFASERDFLRLVSRGRIQVFAFKDDEVLSVSADLSFQPASPPDRLHELLPETIPDLMAAALRSRATGIRSDDPYRWGIAMPERMARQIESFVDRGVSGELVIDRFGEVRHHEA